MSGVPGRRRRLRPGALRARRGRCRSFARTAIESAASGRAESCGPVAPDLIEQPGARQADIAMHGRRRSAERSGDLLVGQAAEIMQLDDLRQARFHLLQTLERVIEGADVEA